MVFKAKINWCNEVDNIRKLGLSGKTVKEIGNHYGVSKQRIAQVIKKLNIFETTEVWGSSVKYTEKRKAHTLKWGTWCKDQETLDKYQACREKFRAKKANATRSGIEFSINFGELDFPTHCPILGIELDYFSETGRQENNPSFDRKDPSKGYVAGNVFVVSWRANRIKNDGTAEEHRQIFEWMNK